MAKFCEFCGKELTEVDHICPNCGAAISGDDYQQNTPQQEEPVYEQEAPAKPAKKWMKWLIPTAAVAAVAVVGALLWQPIFKAVAPRTYVDMAMGKTIAAVEKQLDGTPTQILSKSGTCMNNGSVCLEVNYSDSDNNKANGSITFRSDSEAQKWLLDADISAFGLGADFSAYMDSNAFAIGSDALTDGKFYGLTYESFKEDLNASAFAGMLDDEAVEAVTDLVNAIDDSMDSFTNLEPYAEIISTYIDELEPVNGNESIELDGKTKKCSTVAFTIEEDKLFGMLDQLLDLAEKEPVFQNISELSGEATMEDLHSALKDAQDAIDTNATVTYYTYDSKVVNIGIDLNITNTDDESEAKFNMDLCYGENPGKSDTIVTMSADVDGEKYEFKTVSTSSWEGDVYKSKVTVSAKTNGETDGEILQTTEWNKETGKLTLSVEADGEEITCSMKLVETDTGCEISIDDVYSFLNEIAPEVSDLAGEFDCSVKLTLVVGGTVTTPDFTNLDKIDADAMTGIMESVSNFITENESFFGSLLGGGDYDDF